MPSPTAPQGYLILAAGVCSPELWGDLGSISTACIPVGGKPSIHQHIENLDPASKVWVYRDHSARHLEVLDGDRESPVSWIAGSSSLSLAEAVREALTSISDGEYAVTQLACLSILFGDTFVEEQLQGDSIGVAVGPDPERWMFVGRGTDGELRFGLSDQTDGEGHGVVCGAFSISDIGLFLDLLTASILINAQTAFWESWRLYDLALGHSVRLTKVNTWLDIGHIDTFFQSRRSFMRGRVFNVITQSKGRSSIIKSSSDQRKIVAESEWLRSIPSTLQHLIPRQFEAISPADEAQAGYEAEFIANVTLAEAWTCGQLDLGYWRPAVDRLSDVLEILRQSDAYRPPADLILKAQRSMFAEKVVERLDQLSRQASWVGALERQCFVNSRPCVGLATAVQAIHEVTSSILDEDRWSVIHGDFFFGNIIYDRRADRLVLIDPRGSFLFPGVGGDPLYDVCKLSHSIQGEYDFLAADQFRVSLRGNDVTLDVGQSDHSRTTQEFLSGWLTEQMAQVHIDSCALGILEGGVLLSVAVLHHESPSRQIALVARGLQRIAESIDA